MIKVIHISVLVDTNAMDGPFPEDFGSETAESIMRSLSDRKTRKRINGALADVVLDAKVEDLGEVLPKLEDCLCNETYSKGDAFRKSAALYAQTPPTHEHRYFSESYGMVPKNNATRYLPLKSHLPRWYYTSTIYQPRAEIVGIDS